MKNIKKTKTKNKKSKVVDILPESIRPKNIDQFMGQKKIKGKLEIFIKAAKKRKESLDHLLLYGPPGLGKTTLAHLIASELGVNIRVTSGPAIERSGDLASILTNLKDGDILFIDEVHRLNKVVEEALYPAMEDYCLDIILGKGPSARTVRLELPKFSIVAATTRIGLLSSPLRDRFGAIYRLNFYNPKDLAQILKRSAKILKIPIEEDSCQQLAKRSRGTPRIANRLLKRIRDFAQIKGEGKINEGLLDNALKVLEIDSLGLAKEDRDFLKALCLDYAGGPVGLETLSATIAEDIGTVEEVIEPFLIQKGFLKRTKQGRMASRKSFKHLNIPIPKGKQSTLF
ncbi:Holliday junction branch migration DNA helicase RuvB [Candidatus Beckwithbacteria bacterium CG10_big_fil_rev_8_21_14_0_10_34_10]|uniref:Holliday junction branch migration complex subunit RuvB n=1 Tax=Candidatus Beckwithbacteria bacterium CG10_big_fil_rev_8_21_14_0_10_34_10 TaxID=1974495 RepID=A0A2H0WCJ0_9BACT|nr:MAG: Holliday junction branch migration DNA helicase RuvB [Candidatus Beckwithbacteria bacterium CG10_big_fil_rev_8_21_14_0_10_34_10]